MAHGRQPLAGELLAHQIGERRFLQRPEAGVQLLRAGVVEPRDVRVAALLANVGHQHAVGAERAGIARDQNPADAELGRDPAGDRRSHAAERHQRELARVVAALDRDRAHRHHHVGGEHGENAPRRLDRRNAERLGDARANGILRLGARNRHRAIEQHRRIQMSERHQRIGQCRLIAAALVTGRPRKRAGALRADLENAAHRDRRDAAAARADRLDVHRVASHRMARHR